jgi:hypothetical protein
MARTIFERFLTRQNTKQSRLAESPLLFFIGMAALAVEPLLSLLAKKYEGYARLGNLSLLIFAILALIASVPMCSLRIKRAYRLVYLGCRIDDGKICGAIVH